MIRALLDWLAAAVIALGILFICGALEVIAK